MKGPPPLACLLFFVVPLALLCSLFSLESCTPSQQEGIVSQEPSADTQSGGLEMQPAEMISEKTDTPDLASEKTPERSADAMDAGPSIPCTGVPPPYPDVPSTLPPEIDLPETIPPEQLCQYKPGQCPGSPTPAWKLEDFQPQSCGYQKQYNLQAFRGNVVVVALLTGS